MTMHDMIDGFAVVIDARVSRKLGRLMNEQPHVGIQDLYFWGKFRHC